MASHSSILAWEIPWSLAGYSPWAHKESDMTEQLNNNNDHSVVTIHLVLEVG